MKQKNYLITIIIISLLSYTLITIPFNSTIIVISNSMQPTLNIGDLVVIKNQTNYTTNDIIVFTYENKTYIHRIILTINNTYRTKGDNALNIDRWILNNKNIQGIVTHTYPKIGILSMWFYRK